MVTICVFRGRLEKNRLRSVVGPDERHRISVAAVERYIIAHDYIAHYYLLHTLQRVLHEYGFE